MFKSIAEILLHYGPIGAMLIGVSIYSWYQTKRIEKITDDKDKYISETINALGDLRGAIEILANEIKIKMDVLKDIFKRYGI